MKHAPDKLEMDFEKFVKLEMWDIMDDVTYIRKDALLQWLEYTKKLWSQTGSSLAAMQTVQMVIDKINSL